MAKTGAGLAMKASLDIQQAMANARKLNDEYKKLTLTANGVVSGGTGASKAFDVKPLTEYQAGLLKIKQETLELAKRKAETAAADRSASLSLQAALREEAKLKREQIAAEKALKAEQAKRKPTQISNSQAEIDAYKKATAGSTLYTSVINAERVARVQLNVEAAKQAIANNTLTANTNASVNATNNQAKATQAAVLTKKQLAQMLAEEKLRQQQATAELKNNAREMLNAKGSIEQRRAAIARLTTEYNRLSAAERQSAAGNRMAGIIKGLNEQVSSLSSGLKGSENSFANFFSSIKSNVLGTLGPLALLTAAVASVKALFAENVAISDNFVDVQRTAKLTANEVDRLGESLKNITTRTSLEGLVDIGFIGGRLGVAKDDLEGFITTVDKLAVVLKKEFPGGAEAVSDAMGRIVKTYKIAQNEGITLAEAMNKVGSSLLDLAHAGPVTFKYLQDFSLGVAGTAVSAKLSLPQISAYGAVLAEAGTIASSAAISMTRLVNDLSVKRGKYFAIAQLADSTLTIEKFTKLINTDTNEALGAFFRGLRAGNPVQTEFNDRIRSVGITTGKVMNAVKVLANSHVELAEKVRISSKGYQDATSIAHNFELANNSLAASFDKIKNAFVNAFTDSALPRRLAELLNQFTDNRTEAEKLTDAYNESAHKSHELSLALTPLLKRYDELKAKGKINKDEQVELKDVIIQLGDIMPEIITRFDEYGKALDINRKKVTDLTKVQKDLLELQNREALKAATKQFEDANAYLKVANQAYQGSIKAKKDIINAIMDLGGGDSRGRIIQKAKDDVTEATRLAYDAAKAVEKLGSKLSEAQKRVISLVEGPPKKKQNQEVIGTGEFITEEGAERTADWIKAEIKNLQSLQKPLAITSAKYKEYAKQILALKKELREANGVGLESSIRKDANEAERAIKSRNDLQSKFDEITKKGVDKQLDADAQELESVKTKYRLLREEAIKFNNDPVNKKRGLRVDASGFARAESNESESIRAKQETEKLKVVLDDQKKLYEDYEFYKEKLGKDAADKKYAAQLNADKNYLQELKRQEAEILDPEKSKGSGGGDLSAIDKAKLEELQKRIKIEQSLEDRAGAEKYSKAFQAAMTHSQKLKEIEKEYLEQVRALGQGASKEQLGNLKRTADERTQAEKLANADIKNNWAHLFEDFDSMSRGAIIKRLNDAREGYAKEAAAGVSEAKERIRELDRAIDELNGNNSFANIADKFKKWKDAIPGTKGQDDAFADFASAVSDGAQDINEVLGATAQSFAELGIGGEALQATFKNVMGAVDGISGIAKGLATGNPVDIITGSIKLLTSAIALFDTKDRKLQGQIDGYKAQLDALGKAYKQLERDVTNAVGNDVYAKQDEQIRGLIQQQQVLSKLIDAERSKKKADQGKIDGWQSQLDAIPGMIEDIEKTIAQSQIQTTFRDLSNSIADALTDAFADPINNVKAFDNAFDKMVVNAVKNSLKLKYLEPVIARFTEELAAYADANNNSIAGFNFDPWKFIISQAGDFVTAGLKEVEKFFPELEKVIAEGQKSLSGSIITDLTTFTIKDGVNKLGNSITETISDAILQGFQAQMIADGLKDFYKKIEAIQKGGTAPNEAQIAELKAEYDEFLVMYDEKLSALEKATGLSFRKQNEEQKQLAQKQAESINSAIESIADGITGIFSGSEQAGKDFINNFDKLFNDKILSNFKDKFLTDQLASFYTDFAAMTAEGAIPAQSQIEEMRVRYNAIVDASDAELKRLRELTGQKLIPDQKVEVEVEVKVDDSDFDAVKQAIFGVFDSTEMRAEDFGDALKDILRRKIMEGFQQEVFTTGLKAFYDKLSAFQKSGGGLTAAEISELQSEYNTFIADAQNKFKELERITGVSLATPVKEVIEAAVETIDSEFEALQDSILGVFGSLDGSIEDSSAKFESMMKKAVLNSFKTSYLANALKGFYDQLNGYTANGATLTEVQIAALKAQYDAIVKGGQERLKEFERISGISLGDQITSVSSVKGKLQAELTESTANEFVGISRGTFEQTKIVAGNTGQILLVARANLNAAIATANNTKVSADMLVDIQKDIRKIAGAAPDQSFRSLR